MNQKPENSTDGTSVTSGGVTNEIFVESVFTGLLANTSVAVCIKPGDPDLGGWPAKPYPHVLGTATNNYVNVSSFQRGEDNSVLARKEDFAACHAFLLDDIGTKVPFEKLGNFVPSWLIETSPGNFQGGIILKEPLTDGAEASRLLSALMANGLCDKGAGGAMTRWMRLPIGINGKPKHTVEGAPFQCRLTQWHPEARYSAAEIVEGLGLVLSPGTPQRAMVSKGVPGVGKPWTNPVFTPRHDENPVITALKGMGLYKKQIRPGLHDVTCPWVDEHTDHLDNGAAYFEPSDDSAVGGFCCQHSHRDQYRIAQLTEHLGIDMRTARNRPVIRVVAGELGNIIDAADFVLAEGNDFFNSGGQIVEVIRSPLNGDPRMVPVNLSSLTVELAKRTDWERVADSKTSRIDPSDRHVKMLYGKQEFRHLMPLEGLARQPYFRESDGELVMSPGYDAKAMRYGVFAPSRYQFPEPTRKAAEDAAASLVALLSGFCFATEEDRGVALGALLTAAVRPSLATAPGFHVTAPVMGSGKSFLCELIAAMAGPTGSIKMSYPKHTDEATKMILAALQGAPAVIEFDDMDTDWIPHGSIKRMFTASAITDRLLGTSKTSTVSTRVLVLGSGNNVAPIRDLRRRVATIYLDPKCEIPAMKRYIGDPVAELKANREKYVMAALTIVMAWKKAGLPHADLPALASFGNWSSYCRQPLVWLGYPDPAHGLIEQLKADPDVQLLEQLMIAWRKAYKQATVTVRTLATDLGDHEDLADAIRDLPVIDGNTINRRKLGWYLSKHRDRIVSGHKFTQVKDASRDGWRLVQVDESVDAFQSASSGPETGATGSVNF